MTGIPDYKSFVLPFLQALQDGQPQKMSILNESLAQAFHFSEQERAELTLCGRQIKYKNRIVLARTFLKKTGLIEELANKNVMITEQGKLYLGQSSGEPG